MKPDAWLLSQGEKTTVRIIDRRGNIRTPKNVRYFTDNPAVAVINEKGIVTAGENGWVGISAHFDGTEPIELGPIMLTVMERRFMPELNMKRPRLLLDEVRLESVQRNIKENKLLGEWYSRFKEDSLNMLTADTSYENIVRGGTTYSPYAFANWVASIALLYKIEGDKKYYDTVVDALRGACTVFPDWSQRTLYVGLMSFAAAIGYDWLYDDMDVTLRKEIKTGILEKGIKPYLEGYRNYLPGKNNLGIHTRSGGNHNSIPSSGLGLAALAVGDDEGKLCEEIFQDILLSLPIYFNSLEPDGAIMEGPLYWTFGCGVLGIFLAALNTSMSSYLGFDRYRGFSRTGYFPMYMLSPAGLIFNYADANTEHLRDDRGGADVLFEIARIYNNSDYMWFNTVLADKEPRVWSVIGYDPDLYKPESSLSLAKDKVFRGDSQVGSFRSQWNESVFNQGLFLGFKGGKGDLNHADMDAGTFVLDALGERWIWDLGRDQPYPGPGICYWNRIPGGTRWTFYKKRAEGHNTILINPDENEGQDIQALTEIIEFRSSEHEAAAAIDLSPAYRRYGAEKVLRRFDLRDNRSKLRITDTIQTTYPSDMWWFFHTKAEIAILQNENSAVFRLGKKEIKLHYCGPQGIDIFMMKSVPLENSPSPALKEENREEFSKLTFRIRSIKNVSLVFEFEIK